VIGATPTATASARPLVRDRRLGRARVGDGRADERPENVVRKGRLQPGKLFLVDLA
jgi:hypothetical protein